MKLSKENILQFSEFLKCSESSPSGLVWIKKGYKSRYQVGEPAGWKQHGYWFVRSRGQTIGCHRLVFFFNNGFLPENVDHIDGNGLNNSLNNLRAASHAQNQQNKRKRADNTSGVTGVSFDISCGLWRARVNAFRKSYFVGVFKNFEDACAAVSLKRKALHLEFANGE